MQKIINLEKPLKVLLINTLYFPNLVGGAERSVQLLAEGLQNLGKDVIVVSLDAKRSNSENVNGVKVYYLKNKNVYWPFDKKHVSNIKKYFWHFIDTYLFLYKNEFEKILKIESPDIIHTNNLSGFSSSILDYLKSKQFFILHTARDYHLLCYKNVLFKDNRICEKLCKDCQFLSKWKLKQVNLNVDRFVGISNHIIQRHVHAGLNSKIPMERIFNAVEFGNVDVPKNQNNKVKSFGFLGSINEAKGIEILLNMFCSNPIKNEKWQLKIAGRGTEKYLNFLKNKFQNKNIEFLGFVESNYFYDIIDALIVPSQWEEPFGRVVIEAAQKKIPVFVSNKGGLEELKKELDLVKEFTVGSIMDFMNAGLNLDNTNQSQINQFDNKIITNKYLEAYKKVLGII